MGKFDLVGLFFSFQPANKKIKFLELSFYLRCREIPLQLILVKLILDLEQLLISIHKDMTNFGDKQLRVKLMDMA